MKWFTKPHARYVVDWGFRVKGLTLKYWPTFGLEHLSPTELIGVVCRAVGPVLLDLWSM